MFIVMSADHDHHILKGHIRPIQLVHFVNIWSIKHGGLKIAKEPVANCSYILALTTLFVCLFVFYVKRKTKINERKVKALSQFQTWDPCSSTH